MDFNCICMNVTLGHDKELIKDLIFNVTAGLKLPNLSRKVLVCTISHDLVGRFQQDLHGYNTGT